MSTHCPSKCSHHHLRIYFFAAFHLSILHSPHQSVSVSTYLCIYLSIHLPIYLATYLSVFKPMHPPIIYSHFYPYKTFRNTRLYFRHFRRSKAHTHTHIYIYMINSTYAISNFRCNIKLSIDAANFIPTPCQCLFSQRTMKEIFRDERLLKF